MPLSTSVLAALSKLLARQTPTASEAAALAAAREAAPPQKMLQGMYRGYAGDYDAAKAAQDAGLVYVTPQRAAAEAYANNRVKQAARRGEKVDPHVEMVLVDPASGRRYGHSTLGTGEQGPLRTLAAELQPEDVVSTTNLYAEGGEVSADELNRPYIGYRSAGRRPESQQDRRAAADAPLSALRGMLSGVLGAPGDIESLIRMLPGLSERTVLPTSEDVERRLQMPELNQTPTGRAFTTAGQLGGGFYTGPGSPLRAVATLPSAVSRAGRDFVMAAGQPAVNVVKPKGGRSLDKMFEKYTAPEAAGKQVVPGSHAGLLNQWLTEQPQDAIAAINRNVFSRKSGASQDYELRMMPVDSVKPTQAGEDYLNDSSRYTAKELKTKDIYNIHRTEDALPIILDEAGNIADGNHRHAAAVLNGEKVIPALVPVGKGTGKVINFPERDEVLGFSHGGQVRGYAEGGQVSGANFPTDDFDPARIDAIVGELHAMNAG